MFVDLIFAGVIAAAGAWQAPATAPAAQPAVIRSAGERADREAGERLLHLAADLGCPRYRGGYHGDFRGLPRRCRPRHAIDPYHNRDDRRYDRFDEGDRAERFDDSSGFRGDRLTDRDGRPFRGPRDFDDRRFDDRDLDDRRFDDRADRFDDRSEEGFDDEPERFRGDERRDFGRDRSQPDRFHDRGEREFRSRPRNTYRRSSYDGAAHKKKDTPGMSGQHLAV